MKTRGMVLALIGVLVVLSLVLSSLMAGCSSPAPTPAPATTQTQNPSTTAPANSTAKPTTSAPTPATSAPAAVKTLKFAFDMPPTGAITGGWNWFAAELEKRTNGQYKIQFFPAQTLVKQSEQLNALQAGIADIISCQLTSQQQAFPVNAVVSLPSVAFPDNPAGHLAARQAARALVDKFPSVAAEFKNFKVLFRHPLPAYIMITKKTKVLVPSDIKGLKIATEGVNKDVVSLAGGSPVNMVPPDMYPSLEKGVVDGAMVGWFHMVSQHFEEVTSYFMDYHFGQQPQSALMNQNSWNSLPPDIQKLITELTPQAEATSTDTYMVQIQKGKDLVKAKNGTVSTLNADQQKAWADAIAPMDKVWLDDMKSRGVTDAPAILDFMKQASAAAWAANK